MFNFFRSVKKSNKKIVVYTAIFGGKDKLIEPKIRPNNVDFLCFTDSDLVSRYWKIVKTEGLVGDSTRSARRIKILAHKYVKDYDYSVWVDGNLLVRGDINALVDKYLEDKNLAIFNHSNNQDSRDCIYDEAESIFNKMEIGRYKDVNREEIQMQISKYQKDQYPRHNGLAVTMVILRRHNSPDVINVMEDWWHEVLNYSKRDQISFNYVVWKNGLDFIYLPGDSRKNKFFKWTPHIK